MTTFNDRETAFENKFAHDADLQFKVTARRNKLLGMWAASRLGHEGDAAENYAKSVVVADLEEAGDEDVVRKLVADLGATDTTVDEIRAALAEKAAEARRQIMEAM